MSDAPSPEPSESSERRPAGEPNRVQRHPSGGAPAERTRWEIPIPLGQGGDAPPPSPEPPRKGTGKTTRWDVEARRLHAAEILSEASAAPGSGAGAEPLDEGAGAAIEPVGPPDEPSPPPPAAEEQGADEDGAEEDDGELEFEELTPSRMVGLSSLFHPPHAPDCSPSSSSRGSTTRWDGAELEGSPAGASSPDASAPLGPPPAGAGRLGDTARLPHPDASRLGDTARLDRPPLFELEPGALEPTPAAPSEPPRPQATGKTTRWEAPAADPDAQPQDEATRGEE